MTFLPVIERELRVAARRGVTYWTRAAAALVVAVIAGAVLLLFEVQRGTLFQNPGTVVFAVLKWLSFGFVALAGLFLTADCLSEEKREGTLGLLFLTDLRGLDVVLGKVLAASLWAAYGLLATFPVLGLTFLLGGVSAGEFGRVLLVLGNTLFFSLAAGTFVSSISRHHLKALTGALALHVGFFLLLPMMDGLISQQRGTPFLARLSVASPSVAFLSTSAGWTGRFWLSAAGIHGLGWLFLALAGVFARRHGPETGNAGAPGVAVRARREGQRADARQRPRRIAELEKNPMTWLAGHDVRLKDVVFRAVLYGGGGMVLLLAASLYESTVWLAVGWVGSLIGLALMLWVAAQAAQFLVDGRRNGMLELLLVTPVPAEAIARGQAQALRKVFLIPALTVLALQACGAGAQNLAIRGSFSPGSLPFVMVHAVAQAISLVSFLVGLWAIAWFGMWMGLTSRKTSVALLKTVLFVAVLPWLALMFVQMFLMFSVTMLGPGLSRFYLVRGAVGVLDVGVSLFLGRWAQKQVLANLRAYVAEGRGALAMASPPPLPPPAAAPPVIAP